MGSRLDVVAILIASAAAYTHGQQVNCGSKIIPLTVVTQDGKAVEGLTLKDFSARARSKAITISEVDYDTTPRRILLLLDVSSSMTFEPRLWASSLFIARELVNSTPSKTALGLATFATAFDYKIEFTVDHTTVIDQLASIQNTNWKTIKAPRHTAVRDALRSAIHTFQPTQVGDSIILISDGIENESMQKQPALQKLLASSGVRVFSLIPARYDRIQTFDAEILGLVPQISAITGGDSIVFPWSLYATKQPSYAVRVTATATLFLKEIQNLYRIRIEVPNSKNRRKLSIAIRNQKTQGLTVLHPSTLEPCH